MMRKVNHVNLKAMYQAAEVFFHANILTDYEVGKLKKRIICHVNFTAIY